MKKACCLLAVALAAVPVCFSAVGELVGGEYVVSVASGVDVTLDAGDISSLGANVNLVKKGLGRLIIASDLVGWVGEARIEEGYLRVRHLGALGYTDKDATSGGLVVKNGGTLEIDGSVIMNNNATVLSCKKYTLEGTGVGGTAGAVYVYNGSSYWYGTGKLVFTGDTTFKADRNDRQLDMRYGPVDFNGHTITADGIRLCICNGTPSNIGNFVVLNKGGFVSEQTNFGTASQEHAMTLDDGALFKVTRIRNNYNWFTLDFLGASTWGTQSWSDDILNPCNILNGPVKLGGTATVSFNKSSVSAPYASGTEYNTLELKGPVSGAGGFTVQNAWFILSNPTNSFSGKVTVDGANGHVIAKSWGALPALTNGQLLVKNNASCEVKLNAADDPPSAQMDEGLRTFFSNSRSMVQNSGLVGVSTTGAYTYTTPSTDAFGPLAWCGGTLVFAGCGDLDDGGLTNLVGAVWPDIARVVVSNGAAFSSPVATPINVNDNMTANDRHFWVLGRSIAARANMRGILEIVDGGTFSNRVHVGGYDCSASSMGSLFLRAGGEFHNPYQSNSTSSFGNSNEGYAEVDPDAHWYMGREWFNVGCGANGYGVFWQKGGRVEQGGQNVTPGFSGGHGRVRMSGGTFASERGLMLCRSLWGSNANPGDAVLTVENDAKVSFKDYAVMGATSGSKAILNLNGGTFTATAICLATNLLDSLSYNGTSSNYDYENNRADVNFNGGTYKPYADWIWMTAGYNKVKHHVSRITVYAGGAKIDTSGKNCLYLDQPLECPSGKGVTNVPFSCSVPWNYTGSPVVTIDGDGTGASAFAEFDSTNGTITGVVVTSPGNDYTTATATIRRGGWTNLVTVPLTPYLADNDVSGGLTKLGDGKLVLQAVNTYKGPTVVEQGTLKLEVDNAIDPASHLRVAAGATLDLDGKALTTSGLLSGAGTIIGNLTIAGTWTIDADDILARTVPTVNGRVTFAPGTKIHVKNAEKLSRTYYPLFNANAIADAANATIENLDSPWCVDARNGVFRIGFRNGTVVVFR